MREEEGEEEEEGREQRGVQQLLDSVFVADEGTSEPNASWHSQVRRRVRGKEEVYNMCCLHFSCFPCVRVMWVWLAGVVFSLTCLISIRAALPNT